MLGDNVVSEPGRTTAAVSDEVNGMTEIERRRAERRRKILMNQEDRYKKILGPNAAIPKVSSPTLFQTDDSDEPVLPEEHLTREFLSNAQQQQRQPNGIDINSPMTSSPKYYWNHRLYLIILATCLPLFGLNYVLIYFLVWESAVMMINGGIPCPPAKPNLLLTLVMFMGLREDEANRIKLLIRITKWIWSDFCIFFISLLIPQIGLELCEKVL